MLVHIQFSFMSSGNICGWREILNAQVLANNNVLFTIIPLSSKQFNSLSGTKMGKAAQQHHLQTLSFLDMKTYAMEDCPLIISCSKDICKQTKLQFCAKYN